MVDTSAKTPTRRVARASGEMTVSAEALAALTEGRLSKGDAFAVARVAGIQAAKETARLIPLCHPLALDHVAVTIEPRSGPPGVYASAEIVVTGRTGAEMEALTAVATSLLTIYDMLKSLDRGMEIGPIRLDHKSGGASGAYERGGAR